MLLGLVAAVNMFVAIAYVLDKVDAQAIRPAVEPPRIEIIACFGMLQALLYCCLLPMWQGYDEPYHFAYAQQLVVHRTLPVLDQTMISMEVRRALELAPESYVPPGGVPGMLTLSEYFALPERERHDRRARLYSIDPALREQPGGIFNYEAQQPPLSYLPLAIIELIGQRAPLHWRLWLMRMFAAFASVALILLATERLARRAGLPPAYRAGAVFLLCSTQNMYAAIAHAGNDWLSAPFVALLFVGGDRFHARRDARSAALFAAILAGGLLAKSYFLVFVPVAILFVAWTDWRRLPLFIALLAAVAGPWYLRNWILYHGLSGLQTNVRTIPLKEIIHTARSIAWPATLLGMARGALWGAIYLSFSKITLNILLTLLASGLFMRVVAAPRRAFAPIECITAAGSLIFLAVPVYAIAVFAVFSHETHPASYPWYCAGLLPGAFVLSFRGFSVARRIGVWAACACLAVSLYITAATWFAKLLPAYAGYDSRARPAAVFDLYAHHLRELMARSGESSLAGGGSLVLLAAASTVAAAMLAVQICRAMATLRSE